MNHDYMHDIIILTGMSGAGKSQAGNFFEDRGYFCVDNLPPVMLPPLVRTFLSGQGGEGFGIEKLAFVVDIRSNELLRGVGPALQELEEMGCAYKIVFLEAADQVLINRFRQTRRLHPLAVNIGLTEAIEKERTMLLGIRARATHVIDTSFLAIPALRDELFRVINATREQGKMSILIESFGFKYGIPVDCDNTYDVRFLPNPFYLPDLKPLSGKDDGIAQYLQDFPETEIFLNHIQQITTFTLPLYEREGKARLVIGIGCTGGRHRSVYITEKLAESLGKEDYSVKIFHRDIDKDPRYAAPPAIKDEEIL